MGASPGKPWLRRARSVHEDWLARLPSEKDSLFDDTVEQLESVYAMLSVTLDEALALRAQGALGHARTQAGVAADLFDRLAASLGAVVRTLEQHGRHFGTLPSISPLNPQFFRGETSRRIAWKSSLLCKVLFTGRSRFFHKLHALAEIVEELMGEFRQAAEEIAYGASVQPSAHWKALDILHYDLNTSFREAIVVLKSFLCALPNDQVHPLQQKLLQASRQVSPRRPRVLHGSS